MADRTAAAAFGSAFAWQAKNRKPKLTKWLRDLAESYDFTSNQMNADEQLLKLGLISKKDAGPEPSSALSFGPASLDGLFKVFERDGNQAQSAELAQLSGKKDPFSGVGRKPRFQPVTLYPSVTATQDDDGPGLGTLLGIGLAVGIVYGLVNRRPATATA